MYLIFEKETGEIIARVKSMIVAYQVARGDLEAWEV